ncbi:hypothetical protein [Leptospira santarosai]|uniref:hypothetical protein n=1 Tax=Leptospira santarosai TaxID=28183 RepID=UPI0018DEE408|nr:hypothetical protein [Leptospira santarosai]
MQSANRFRSAAFGYLTPHGSFIFALQSANRFRSAAFGYLTPHGSFIFALQSANRFRSAAFGYLTPHGSFIFALQSANRFRSAAFGYLTPHGSFDRSRLETQRNASYGRVSSSDKGKNKNNFPTQPIRNESHFPAQNYNKKRFEL